MTSASFCISCRHARIALFLGRLERLRRFLVHPFDRIVFGRRDEALGLFLGVSQDFPRLLFGLADDFARLAFDVEHLLHYCADSGRFHACSSEREMSFCSIE